MTSVPGPSRFRARHFISALDLDRVQIGELLDLSDSFVDLNRQKAKKLDLLKGRTMMNLFFENSTRTQSSFELAGKRLGADVVNMSPRSSSMSKGETLIDTAVTLNAMQPDLLVVRHSRRPGPPSCWPRRSTAASSTPATASTSIRPRPCSTPCRSAAPLADIEGLHRGHLRRRDAQPGRPLQHACSLQSLGAQVRLVGPADPDPRRRPSAGA